MLDNNKDFETAEKTAAEKIITEENEDTTPLENTEITVPIKFNKEIREIPLAEAAVLAQKGMKFDLISEDYKNLKELSLKSKKSVPQFLEDLKTEDYNKRVKELCEKCGGDEALAQHITDLENKCKTENLRGFGELQKNFPKFKTLQDLPEEIIEAATLKGTLLLDEYLRYLLAQKRNAEERKKLSEFSNGASIGSQLNRNGNISPEASEFLKGLWK